MLKQFIKSLTLPFDEIAIQSNDADDIRLGKQIFVRLHLIGVPITLFLLIQSFFLDLQIFIIFGFVQFLAQSLNLIFLRLTGRFKIHFNIYILMTILLPYTFSAISGGFNVNSHNMWPSFLPLLLVVLLFGRREIILWFIVFSGLAILSGYLEPYVVNPEYIPSSLPFDIRFNTILVSAIILLMLYYYKREKNSALNLLTLEKKKSENLLQNILPTEIAEILKVEERTIADQYDHASILFSDLVGFTPLSEKMKPKEMIDLLNNIYSHFDALVDKYHVEKIRTIGDNYMVAAGVPVPMEDHAHALANLALDMLLFCQTLQHQDNNSINFRIGINSGPLVAGVIGKKKFQYDVWGDTVNTASRMESHGVSGKIQITAATYELIKNEFVCEKRGSVDIKGKGKMETWFLVGRNK